MGAVAPRVSSPVFVGRVRETAQLRAALERARSGSPAVVVVGGEAGVGKSRLLGELRRQARELDVLTLAGGCLDVGEGVVPFAPIVEALRPVAALLEPAELEQVLGGARAELARLVPELAVGDQPSGALLPGRLFELLLGALHRLAETRPVQLLIEDVHWADRSTRDMLGFLIRNLQGGIALVLTYRSDELHRRHPLRPFLVELARSGRAERLEVERLAHEELIELIGGILGEAPMPGLAADVWARSEGNPFFAEELIAARIDGVVLPGALRDVLLTRVEGLSEESRRLLQVAAVAGRRVDHRLLADVTGLPAARLVEWLREAVTHHILSVEGDGGDGGYAFRHALMQEAIYDDLLPMQRVPLHAACARALAGRAEQPEGHAPVAALGQLAYHWYAARDMGEALVASVRAGQAAEAAAAPGEAERHYQRALGLWAQEPGAAARSPLDHRAVLRQTAEVMFLVGDSGGAVKMASRALAETDPAIEPLVAGALLERLARYHSLNGDGAEAMLAAERAVATVPATPPSPDRARALAAHGQMLMVERRMAAARARCEEAVAVARLTGARAEEGHALNTLGCALAGLGHVEVGIAHLQEAYRIASELRDPYDLCRARFNLSSVLLHDGHHEEAVAVARECADLARQFGMTFQFALRGSGPEALVYLGRWDEAERMLDEGVDVERGFARIGRSLSLCTRALLRLWRGDLAGARIDLAAAVDGRWDALHAQLASSALATMAGVATWEGRPSEARATVSRGLEAMEGVDDADQVIVLCLAGLEAEAAIAERAAAAHDTPARAEAAAIAANLLRRAREAASADGVVPTGMGRAMLLTAEAHHTRVMGHSDHDRWAEAAAVWEALDCPWPAAYAGWRQAEALLATGVRRDGAASPLRQAWETAGGLGARLLVAEVESLGRRSRIELAQTASPSERTDGTAPEDTPGANLRRLGVTPREIQVLGLVAEGHTNRQIADRLFISDRTASVHVSNILGKLGVANRAEAAVAAHRLGLNSSRDSSVGQVRALGNI
jgi:DNA-binding CsgD family transcriptional regulator/tetratricopeptide (TPR) repeat protein